MLESYRSLASQIQSKTFSSVNTLKINATSMNAYFLILSLQGNLPTWEEGSAVRTVRTSITSAGMSLKRDSNTYLQIQNLMFMINIRDTPNFLQAWSSLFPSVKATWPDQTSGTYTQMQVSRETGGTGSQLLFLHLCTVILELLPQWDHPLGLHIIWWDSHMVPWIDVMNISGRQAKKARRLLQMRGLKARTFALKCVTRKPRVFAWGLEDRTAQVALWWTSASKHLFKKAK